jgi:hypothetical protein
MCGERPDKSGGRRSGAEAAKKSLVTAERHDFELSGFGREDEGPPIFCVYRRQDYISYNLGRGATARIDRCLDGSVLDLQQFADR